LPTDKRGAWTQLKELKVANSETVGKRKITNSTTTHTLLFVIRNPSVTTIDKTVC
jgi:hypothetical protein